MERQGTGDGPREEGWVSSGSVFETSTVLVFKEKKRIIDPEAQEWRQLTLPKRKMRAGFWAPCLASGILANKRLGHQVSYQPVTILIPTRFWAEQDRRRLKVTVSKPLNRLRSQSHAPITWMSFQDLWDVPNPVVRRLRFLQPLHGEKWIKRSRGSHFRATFVLSFCRNAAGAAGSKLGVTLW